jgi:uncharacterized DUF497 family protein
MGSQQGQVELQKTWCQICRRRWRVGVFEDENAITIQDEHKREDRFITIGRDFLSRILVVVYAFRDIVIRIISARKATARERKIYEEQDEEGI